MPDLTISLDPRLLEAASMKALQQGTTLADLVRSYLESYVGKQPPNDQEALARQREALARLLDLSFTVQSGSGGRKWTRDEIHDRKD